MEYVILGASIECAAADIISRKIQRTSIQNIPQVGVCKKYKCSRNSEAHITKELTPKVAIVNLKSKLSLNDSVSGETITVFINNIKDKGLDKAPYSARHKAQFGSTKDFTHAFVTVQFPNISEIIDKKQLEALKLKLLPKEHS